MAFRFAPRVPDDFDWWCDVEGCPYNIDLLNLTRENLMMLDDETVAKLRLQNWSLSDTWVRLAFKTMVEDHRVKHLESWGLRCLKGPSGVRCSPPSAFCDPFPNFPHLLGPRAHRACRTSRTRQGEGQVFAPQDRIRELDHITDACDAFRSNVSIQYNSWQDDYNGSARRAVTV
jgi:hypothetical protein